MQMLFQMEAQGDFSQEAEQRFRDEYLDDTEHEDYFSDVYKAVVDHKDAIDQRIEAASRGWHLERLMKIDLAVLRLCLAEMCWSGRDDVPVGASINEAVKLAKKYGTEDSGKFVNGVLGRIARDLEAEKSDGPKDLGEES